MAVRLGVIIFAWGVGAGASMMRAAVPFLGDGQPSLSEWIDVVGFGYCAALCVFHAFLIHKIHTGEW